MSNTAINNSTINIISRHATVAEAVAAAGIDLSYNPQLAAQDIKNLDRGHHGAKVVEAFVTDKGVFYVYQADIKLLNKFEPFVSILDDSDFRVVVIGEKAITLSENRISKTQRNRKVIAQVGCIVH